MKSHIASALVALSILGGATVFAASNAEPSEARQEAERKDLHPTTQSPRRGDPGLQVFNDVVRQVNRYTQLTIFDSISAEVADGKVQLTGWVTMPYKRDDIEKRVRKVDGIASVDNKIGVLPVSQFDDNLRFRIARAIYGHSSFWSYAMMANPPIRVVVNRGHVTLEGVVQSNVERMLARSLASGFGAFDVKNSLKTDAEVRDAMEPRKTN